MKNWIPFYVSLAGQIVLLFGIAIAYSFLTQYLQTSGFFGDVPCRPEDVGANALDSHMDWGARHHLFFWMSVCLFILQVVRLIHWINIELTKKGVDTNL